MAIKKSIVKKAAVVLVSFWVSFTIALLPHRKTLCSLIRLAVNKIVGGTRFGWINDFF